RQWERVEKPAVTALNATRRQVARSTTAAREHLLSGVAEDLAALRGDVRDRANRGFVFLMVYATLATIAVLTGAGLAVAGILPAAVVTTIGGVLSGGVSAVFWRIYAKETKRADDVIRDLQLIEAARVSYLLNADLPAARRPEF